MAASLDTATRKHQCGCQGTNHTLPKLISFFQDDGADEMAYSSETVIAEDIGLRSPCAQCQLETERGVETAISAVHCGPDSLIEHSVIEWMFTSLIELRLKQEEDHSIPEAQLDGENSHHGDEFVPPTRSTSTVSSISSRSSDSRLQSGWDWDHIWHEWAMAFELRRDKVDVAVLFRNLSELPVPRHRGWFAAVLRRLGAEALLAFEGYVSTGLVSVQPSVVELSACRRDVEVIQSIDDLFDLYVDIDSRILGYLHAHKMLRAR
ncbi:hypothetical protein GQX73_g2924 [Xylaria multiplex]|uniref:Uncharacterized protein n=1 Tax=Xylaria multiplex TaxID=323545 RepID=A0A7C8MVP2_9PEZI|nr:hypothetical protein GQX73_g2924 [Xylaria multiplex]